MKLKIACLLKPVEDLRTLELGEDQLAKVILQFMPTPTR